MQFLKPEVLTRFDLQLKVCDTEIFELIKTCVTRFELDDRQLRRREFLALCDGKELLGFGRVREYGGYSEICTLAVLEGKRSLGFGAALTRALLNKARGPIYLVSIIPSFFEKLGFEICYNYPAGIEDKLNYCVAGLPVEEQYVVMRMKGRPV